MSACTVVLAVQYTGRRACMAVCMYSCTGWSRWKGMLVCIAALVGRYGTAMPGGPAVLSGQSSRACLHVSLVQAFEAMGMPACTAVMGRIESILASRSARAGSSKKCSQPRVRRIVLQALATWISMGDKGFLVLPRFSKAVWGGAASVSTAHDSASPFLAAV
jgi:hypothetical protein